MGNIFTDLFSDKPAKEAAAAKAAGYATGRTDANAALTAGQGAADASYDKAYSPFATLFDNASKGAGVYADATGVNGAAGIDRAGSLYKSLPGYSSGLNTGIDAAVRTGQLTSPGGNTAADVIKYASDYDAKHYGDFLSALNPYLGQQSTAAAGGAGVLGAKAATDASIGAQKATTDFNAATGTGDAQAQAALAPYSSSQNFWSALLGGATLAAKASGIGGFAPTPAKA